MTGRVAGKNALVTGAAQGLGAAIAMRLAQEDARVLLTDINEAGAATVAASINAECGAGAAFSARHDVTSEFDWLAALELAREAMGGLSVLVNNAGIGTPGSVEETSLEDSRRCMAVNADSVILGCKHALPLLRESQPASIVNISSIAGLIGDSHMAAYNASKSAVWGLTRSVALYCARSGWNIRCNSVHPAFVDTPILDNFRRKPGVSHDDLKGKLARNIPLGRVGEPEEVALGVIYLASDESSFMTGAELKLDGGLSAG